MILMIFKMIPTMFCLILLSHTSARPINMTTESSPYAQPPEVFISNVLRIIIRSFGNFHITDSLIKAGDPATIKMRQAINETEKSDWDDQAMNETFLDENTMLNESETDSNNFTKYAQNNHEYSEANTTDIIEYSITEHQAMNETFNVGTSNENATLSDKFSEYLHNGHKYTDAHTTYSIGSTEYIQNNHKYTDANTTGSTASSITKDRVLNETLMGTSVETTTLTNESTDELQHNYEYTETNITELKESGITEEQVLDEKIFGDTTNETTITHLSESTRYIQNSHDYTDANTSMVPGNQWFPESDEAKEAGLVDSFTERNIIDVVETSNETIEALKTTDDGSTVSHSNKNYTEESSEIGGASINDDIRMQMKNRRIKKKTLRDIARSTTDNVENPILNEINKLGLIISSIVNIKKRGKPTGAGGTDKSVQTTNKIQIPPTDDYNTKDSSESVETTTGRTESGKSTKSSEIPVPIDSVNDTSPKVTNTEKPHQVNSSATDTTSSTASSIDVLVDKSFQATNGTKTSPTGVNNDTEDSSESVEYEYYRKENNCSNTSNPDAPCGNDTVIEGQRHNETTANDIRKKNREQREREEKERHERFVAIVWTMVFVTMGMVVMANVGCHYFRSFCALSNDLNQGPMLPVIAEEDERTELLEIKKTVEIAPAKQKGVPGNSGAASAATTSESAAERVPLCLCNAGGPSVHENKDQDSLKLEPLVTQVGNKKCEFNFIDE